MCRTVRRNTSGIYISSNDSAHKHNQNWWHRNMYRVLTKEIRAWRDWEVLDEGVGVVYRRTYKRCEPTGKGEQSLTFKRHQRSTVARCTPSKAGPSYVLTAQLIPPMSEINRKVWNWNTQDRILSLNHVTLKELWSWNTETLRLRQFCTRKL